MQTGKANYRLAARLRENEFWLVSDVRKAVEDEHLRAVRRAEGLRCLADRRAFAESVEWERLGDFFLRIGSRTSAVRAYPGRGARLSRRRLLRPRDRDAPLPVPAAPLSADGRDGGGLLRQRCAAARPACRRLPVPGRIPPLRAV